MDVANERWTIEELGRRVKRALADGYQGPSSRRVRAVPDRRTIRYYTTLGLIDRPAEMRGRTALYGRRHLMQLVAIKRLQAGGMSLARVQQRLAGITDAELEQIAAMVQSAADEVVESEEGSARTAEAQQRQANFWQQTPAAAQPPASRADAGDGVRRVTMVELAPGVALQLEGDPRLSARRIDQLRRAARSLIEALTAGPDDDETDF